MKRALHLLLVVWIALQSAWVQAHLAQEGAHSLSHTSHAAHVSHAAHAADTADEGAADTPQEHTCTEAVCCHLAGVVPAAATLCWGQASGLPPATVLWLTSAYVPDDIERPKWPLATFGVAGV